MPNKYYEFTGFSREPTFTSPTNHVGDAKLASYAAWTDIDRLGGVDGPGLWMNANVGANAVYQPIYTDHDNNPATPDQPTGYKNPIPTSVRSPVSGPDTLSAANIYHHSATFITKSDATGNVVVYNWSDPNGYGSTSQGATLLNGFKLGLIPLAGDYNNDAKVDAADYVLWRKSQRLVRQPSRIHDVAGQLRPNGRQRLWDQCECLCPRANDARPAPRGNRGNVLTPPHESVINSCLSETR